MRLLDFKSGNLVIRNQEIIMSYESFMPNKVTLWPKRERITVKPSWPRDKKKPEFSYCSLNRETKLVTKYTNEQFVT